MFVCSRRNAPCARSCPKLGLLHLKCLYPWETFLPKTDSYFLLQGLYTDFKSMFSSSWKPIIPKLWSFGCFYIGNLYELQGIKSWTCAMLSTIPNTQKYQQLGRTTLNHDCLHLLRSLHAQDCLLGTKMSNPRQSSQSRALFIYSCCCIEKDVIGFVIYWPTDVPSLTM